MILRIVIILLTLLNAGYMAFDGARALILGDYLRPQSGEYAGQLGPWATLVGSIGIDPMSTAMKSTFLLLGIYGLIAIAAFAFNPRRSWKLLFAFSTLTLWNLMFGTISSTLALVLLLVWKRKSES